MLSCQYSNAVTNSSGLQLSDLEKLKSIKEITGEDLSSTGFIKKIQVDRSKISALRTKIYCSNMLLAVPLYH